MPRHLQQYPTTAPEIISAMKDNFSISEGSFCLEPTAGHGDLVQAIYEMSDSEIHVDAIELDFALISVLIDKFPSCNVEHADSLLHDGIHQKIKQGGFYDFILANPPYGLKLEKDVKDKVETLYSDISTSDTYAIFLSQAIDLLKPGGRLSFIIPATWLHVKRHQRLREKVLKKLSIKKIHVFPSTFFPGLLLTNAKLTILIAEKVSNESDALSNKFEVIDGYTDIKELAAPSDRLERHTLIQKGVLNSLYSAFHFHKNKGLLTILKKANVRIEDIADCMSGIYTGRGEKHVYRSAFNMAKRAGKQPLADVNQLCLDMSTVTHDGIKGNRTLLPFIRGGKQNYYKENEWFIDWSEDAVKHYRSSKSAKLPRNEFLFRDGIAVPLISNNDVSAALLDKRLFDQSAVGVLPHDTQFLYCLLAFFNTKVCNRLLHTLNSALANAASYIKKIPWVQPSDDDMDYIHVLVSQIIQDKKNLKVYDETQVEELEAVFESIYDV